MALTISALKKDVVGNKRMHSGLVTFDNSYPTGGEALAPEALGLHTIETFDARTPNGFAFDYDFTAAKLKAFRAGGSGSLLFSSTAVGNVGGGTDDLISTTLKAGVLGTNGQVLRVTAWGTTANNANAKTVTLVLGTTTLFTLALTASIAGNWRVQADIIRTGAALQENVVQLVQGATSLVDCEFSATTENLATDLALKMTGAATADNDIIQKGFHAELLSPTATGVGVEVPEATDLSLVAVRFIATGT